MTYNLCWQLLIAFTLFSKSSGWSQSTHLYHQALRMMFSTHWLSNFSLLITLPLSVSSPWASQHFLLNNHTEVYYICSDVTLDESHYLLLSAFSKWIYFSCLVLGLSADFLSFMNMWLSSTSMFSSCPFPIAFVTFPSCLIHLAISFMSGSQTIIKSTGDPSFLWPYTPDLLTIRLLFHVASS